MKSKKTKICIVGLGYVGLPLAVAFGKQEKINGFDILVFLFVNLSNRVGTAIQRHLYMI